MPHKYRFCVLLVLATLCIGGCSTPGGSLSFSSPEGLRVVDPEIRTAVYDYTDANTLDVYLSSVDEGTLANDDIDLATLDGHLIHLHLFIIPKAGNTPIEGSACNVTVRHAIFSRDAFGLYGGAGFALPKWSKAGSEYFKAKVLDATLRLVRSSPAFKDRLGGSMVDGTFTARLDPPMARTMGERIERAIVDLPRISSGESREE